MVSTHYYILHILFAKLSCDLLLLFPLLFRTDWNFMIFSTTNIKDLYTTCILSEINFKMTFKYFFLTKLRIFITPTKWEARYNHSSSLINTPHISSMLIFFKNVSCFPIMLFFWWLILTDISTVPQPLCRLSWGNNEGFIFFSFYLISASPQVSYFIHMVFLFTLVFLKWLIIFN